MRIEQSEDGKSLTVVIEIGESVYVEGASIDVALDESSNTYRTPLSDEDTDDVTVVARQRRESDYPGR